MSAKEDLQKKITSLRDQLSTATASLNEILCAEYPYQPGQIVMRGKNEFIVSSVAMRWGWPVAYGKKKLKDGTWGKQEFEIYGRIEAIHD